MEEPRYNSCHPIAAILDGIGKGEPPKTPWQQKAWMGLLATLILVSAGYAIMASILVPFYILGIL